MILFILKGENFCWGCEKDKICNIKYRLENYMHQTAFSCIAQLFFSSKGEANYVFPG